METTLRVMARRVMHVNDKALIRTVSKRVIVRVRNARQQGRAEVDKGAGAATLMRDRALDRAPPKSAATGRTPTRARSPWHATCCKTIRV
jgi:hypothetical protein